MTFAENLIRQAARARGELEVASEHLRCPVTALEPEVLARLEAAAEVLRSVQSAIQCAIAVAGNALYRASDYRPPPPP